MGTPCLWEENCLVKKNGWERPWTPVFLLNHVLFKWLTVHRELIVHIVNCTPVVLVFFLLFGVGFSSDDQPHSGSSVCARDPPQHCECDGDDRVSLPFFRSTGNQQDPPRPSFSRTPVFVGQDAEEHDRKICGDLRANKALIYITDLAFKRIEYG